MKIVTWNVNSVRARLERLTAALERHQPDVVCLQETKVEDAAFPGEEIERLGYHVAPFGQRTYNGVALLTRQPLDEVSRGFPGDPVPEQARVIAGRVGELWVVDVYVVNGKAVGTPDYEVKLRWLAALKAWLAGRFTPDQPLVVTGDFNVAPDDRDVHDPVRWQGRVLCSEPERAALRELMGWGLRDLLREHTDEAGHHTWWDYRSGAFHRGWGLRIDLMLGTGPVAGRSRSVEVDRDERKKSTGPGGPSDHAPVVAVLGE